jgi:hypothetical protein
MTITKTRTPQARTKKLPRKKKAQKNWNYRRGRLLDGCEGDKQSDGKL